jgi:hypothetical protein
MDDIRNITVLKPTDESVDLGEMFTSDFYKYAKAKNKTYVILQWEKDKPEKAMFDFVNCESAFKAILQLREAVKMNKEEK